MIPRQITGLLKERLSKGKAIVLLGPRQVGKTTLLHAMLDEVRDGLFLDGDEPDIRNRLTEVTSAQLKNLIGNYKFVVIDEAQRIKNIGLTVKLLTDKFKDVQVIVSGSSALELSSTINEPLTGRKFEFMLLPFSTQELVNHDGVLEEERQLEQRLVYGFYPEVVLHPAEARERLTALVSSYLYKDVFTYQDVRKPDVLPNLLEALARQLGSEVTYHEIASLLGVDNETIKRYLDLLEKSFVIFQLRSFSRNLRNELKKSRKIFFYDNGVRNAILGDYQAIGLRSDVGALWENFCISERIKRHTYMRKDVRTYFWRTKQQQEIDYIEEENGKIRAYECKWSNQASGKISGSFITAYKPEQTSVIHRQNYMDFLIDRK